MAAAATISSVQFTPTHDGEAALVVELRFAGGGRSKVHVDSGALPAILARAAVASADALVGHPWTVLDVRAAPFIAHSAPKE